MKKRKVDSSKVDLNSLPFVAFEDRVNLPAKPCLYFVLDSQGVCWYIGQSRNPKQRWSGKTHCLYEDFSKMNGLKIAYLPCPFVDLLYEVEEALIYWYKPEFNGNCVPTTRLTNRESRTLYTFVKFLLQTVSLTSEAVKTARTSPNAQVEQRFNAMQSEIQAIQAQVKRLHKKNCEIINKLEQSGSVQQTKTIAT